ncbi:spermatogenesis-defective protein 39 homolog [Scleropages formosus]|uniref:Spermatogenesis-defective protein 39 homolog n=1 Tax=Scleropages formosus TaxID=113540 RepID=A0A8C9V537_SCLFO|nr:spermatogenesis-defective protein 39 homolog [Scleropages formosus]
MMRSKPDEDDYWNSSKCRAFTFDDDYDELSSLKESKRAVNSIRQFVVDEDEDEDDMVKVSWSGEPIGSITWSIKETASSTKQEQSFPKIDSGPSLPRQGSGYSLSSLFKGRGKSGSFQAISESFSEPSTRNFAPELRKPKSEYKDYVSDWSPEETVKRMQRGKFCSLETFRSLKDKMQLLDQAVCANDGNVITAVLIYLKKSLSKEVLSRELMSRDVALRHYIHYLKEMGEQKLLVELFKSLGRTEDMALLQYREHLSIKDEVRRKEYLKSCISLPFPPDDAGHVQDHYTLLERQIIIEANDKHLENKGQVEVFKKHPRKASILNMPIITTLYYSCVYHYGESEGTYSSPANIRSTFKISEKQYLLTALSARAKLKEWLDVGSLFTTKNWLGYTKKRSPIGFHRVVDILHKNNAPAQVLQEYVCLVEDPNLKISLAQKYKCHDIVIDMYKDQKDRQQLIVYQGKVERGSPEDKKIQDILNNTQIRWKN